MSNRTPSIPNLNARKHQLPCRVSADEMKTIIELAKKYAQGNVSRWVRYAALNLKLKQGQKILEDK